MLNQTPTFLRNAMSEATAASRQGQTASSEHLLHRVLEAVENIRKEVTSLNERHEALERSVTALTQQRAPAPATPRRGVLD